MARIAPADADEIVALLLQKRKGRRDRGGDRPAIFVATRGLNPEHFPLFLGHAEETRHFAIAAFRCEGLCCFTLSSKRCVRTFCQKQLDYSRRQSFGIGSVHQR